MRILHGGRPGWHLGETVDRSPSNAVRARVSFSVKVGDPTRSAKLWIDDVIVSELEPMPTGKPVYTYPLFVAPPKRSFDVVDDPHAGGELDLDMAKGHPVAVRSSGGAGKVLHSKLAKHAPGLVYARHLNIGPPASQPGRYRAIFYMKLGRTTVDRPIVELTVRGHRGFFNDRLGGEVIRGPLAATDGYQAFEVPFVRPPVGTVGYIIYWRGHADVWYDRLEIVTEKVFTDHDMAAYWPMADLDPDLKHSPLGDDVLVVCGLFSELWRLDEALGNVIDNGNGGRVTRSWLTADWSGQRLTPPFPATVDALWSSYRAVILANVGVTPLGVNGRKALADYVRLGGTLLVLGGPQALRAEEIRGSFLEPILPVTVPGAKGLLRLERASLKPAAGFGPAQGLAWEKHPGACYLNDVAAKAGTRVCLTAGERPALITGEHGRGRVGVFAATVFGEPTRPGGTAFWNWPDWSRFTERTIQWLTQP